MITFNPDDVKQLARYALDNYYEINSNGADYCSSCGCTLDYKTGEGSHRFDCITKIAQDVLTGLD